MARFYDADVRAWKDYVSQQSLPFQTPATLSVAASRREQLSMAACSTLVVLVYDTRLVLYNYISCAKTTVYNSAIGCRVTAMDVLTNIPAIALGGRDGSVRLWDPEEMTIIATLTGGIRSGTAVTQLHTFTAKDGKPCLLCGAADGTVTLWDLSNQTLIGESHAHGGAVNDISYSPLLGCAYTVSADRTLATWIIDSTAQSSPDSPESVSALEEKSIVSTGKIPYLQVSPWGLPQHFSDSLLVLRKDSNELIITYPEQAVYEPLLSTSELLAPSLLTSTRRDLLVANILNFIVHPTRPDILLLSTTRGVLLIRVRCPADFRVCHTDALFVTGDSDLGLEMTRSVSGCSITPPPSFPSSPSLQANLVNLDKKSKRISDTPLLVDDGKKHPRSRVSGVGREQNCCVCLYEQNHCLVSCDIAQMLRSREKRASVTLAKANKLLASSQSLVPMTSRQQPPQELFALQSSDCVVTLSSDRFGIIVQYRGLNRYEIHSYDDTAQLWTVASEGSYCRNVFAASSSFVAFQEDNDSSLTVESYGGTSPEVIYSVPAAKSNKVTQLFGGRKLIGVVTEYQIDIIGDEDSEDTSSSKTTTQLHFYPWDGILNPQQRVGPIFSPAPDCVVWDKSGSRVALMYNDTGTFELYAYTPEHIENPIELLRRYEGRHPASLVWSDDHPVVFTSMRDAILCDFYRMLDGPVTIASRTALSTPLQTAKTPKGSKAGKAKAPDMAVLPLPRGDLTLVSVTGRQLIAMDSSRVFYSFSLGSNVFRFLDNLCAGSVERAMRITKKINKRFHPILAKYLIASCHAPEVLFLTGLSDWEKLRHCHRFGLYAEAIPLVRSLVEQIRNGTQEDKPTEITDGNTRSVPINSRTLMRVVASMAADLRRQPGGDKEEIADELLAAAYDAAPATATIITALHYVESGYAHDIRTMVLPKIEHRVITASEDSSPVSTVHQLQSSALLCRVLSEDESGASQTWSAVSNRPARPQFIVSAATRP